MSNVKRNKLHSRLGQVCDDPLEMYQGDLMTVNLNLAGARPYSAHSRYIQTSDFPETALPESCRQTRRFCFLLVLLVARASIAPCD